MLRAAHTVALLFPVVVAGVAAAQPQGSSETAWGLSTTTFETPGGPVTVHLPADLAAGDTLSGTVFAEPREERGGAGDTLSGVVLEVGEEEVPASGGAFRALVAAGGVALTLRGPDGVIGRATVPAAPSAPPAGELVLPALGQSGRPLTLLGPFDGDLGTSAVEIDGRPVAVLAESPRRLVVQVPAEISGPVDLAVSEGGTTTEGTIRILGLDLSADKLDLRRGEETRLQVEVRGLEGLEEPVPIEITNQSPAVVRVEGGESQGVTLRPADVRPDGTAVVERDVTGRKPGGFSISAVVPAVAQPGGLQPGGVPRPVFQDRPPGTCACASLTATDTTERALRTKIHVSPLTAQGVQGLEVRMPRTFRHELACGSGDRRCEATPAWSVQVLQARLIGARVSGQPRELSTRGANPNQTLGLGPAPAIGYVGTDVISSPCGQATTRARSASLTLKLLLPQDVKEAIARGEEVTFDGIEVQSRWSATGCTANAVAFADAEAYTRRDAKPGFTGWNRGGRQR